MLSPYRTQPNITNKRTKRTSNTNFDNNPHRGHDLKGLQMTSNGLGKFDTKTDATVKRTSSVRNKHVLTTGSVHENNEIDVEYSYEIIHKTDR